MSAGVYIENGKAFCGCCRVAYADCRRHLDEIRLSRTAEGRAQLRAEYYAEIRGASEAHRDETKRLREIGVPTIAQKATLNPKPTDALAACRDFMRGDKVALVLWGQPGTGKSVAACRAAYEFCGASKANTYEPAKLILARDIARASDFDQHAQALVAKAKGVPLLVLDDMGQEGTDWGRQKVAEVLLYRLDNAKRLIITTNRTPKDLTDALGVAVLDRLKAAGISKAILGDSMRNSAKTANQVTEGSRNGI